MKFNSRRTKIAFTTALSVVVYLLIGVYFTDGKVMASSRFENGFTHRTIIIREGPGTPIWAWPLARLNYEAQYRFEYYGGNAIWSCQSYIGKSYTAYSARIEWNADDMATVYLDNTPIFTCTEGWWNKVPVK